MQLTELPTYLENLAKQQRCTTYSELTSMLGLPDFDGNWSAHPLARIFENLDAEDHEHNRPFRTSAVVKKANAGEHRIPGLGYFKSLAKLKGVRKSKNNDEVIIHATELKALYDYYQTR